MSLVWTVSFNFGIPSTCDIGIIYPIAEGCLAIMASCGSALRPLFARCGCLRSLAETIEGRHEYDAAGAYRRYYGGANATKDAIMMTREYTVDSETESMTRLTDKETREQ